MSQETLQVNQAPNYCRFCADGTEEEMEFAQENLAALREDMAALALIKRYSVIGITQREAIPLLTNHEDRALAHALAMGRSKERASYGGGFAYGCVLVICNGMIDGKYPI